MARKISSRNIFCVLLILLLIICAPGGCFCFDPSESDELERVANKNLPFLTFYTTKLATTPQLAFWQAVEKGRILERCNIRVRFWENLDQLQTAMLAGKGDLWLGHTDSFVMAALQGAPVQLLLTTGWRKFYLVSSRTDRLHFNDFIGKSLAFTPPGSPAVSVLRSVGHNRFAAISFIPYKPKELMGKLMRGDITTALLPEPLVTRALSSRSDLLPGENVADIYGQYSGHLQGMPLAGIAVNAKTARKYPEIISWIAKETLRQAKILQQAPEKGVKNLPQEFQAVIAKNLVQLSLQREKVYAAYSSSVRLQIEDYMDIISGGQKNPLPDCLFWK